MFMWTTYNPPPHINQLVEDKASQTKQEPQGYGLSPTPVATREKPTRRHIHTQMQTTQKNKKHTSDQVGKVIITAQ